MKIFAAAARAARPNTSKPRFEMIVLHAPPPQMAAPKGTSLACARTAG
jgi:hypothetical protein